MTSQAHANNLLAATIRTSINRTIRDHRIYTETLGEQAVKDGTELGVVELDGDGEVLVDVSFALRFFQLPVFTAGLELRDNSFVSWGAFPTWSAAVINWKTEDANADTVLYTGATLAVVTSNTLRASLHYSFQAKAFTGPATAGVTVTGTI